MASSSSHSGDSSKNTNNNTSLSFSEVFAPLAHHFFPDGCPEEELQDVWPGRANRHPVSADQALESIRRIQESDKNEFFSLPEVHAVMTVVRVTLPQPGRPAGSPLVDGSSQHAKHLIRAIRLPSRRQQQNSDDRVWVNRIVTSLLSSSTRMDEAGRQTVLQFLFLAVRHGGEQLKDYWKQPLATTFYSLLLQWALRRLEYRPDAVRLILLVTQRSHATRYRAQQIRACWEHHHKSSTTSSTKHKKQQRPLLALLQLYARLNPTECGEAVPAELRTTTAAWIAFSDPAWARAFVGETDNYLPHKKRPRSSTALASFLDRLPLDLNNESLFSTVSDINAPAVRHGILLSSPADTTTTTAAQQNNLLQVRLRNNLPHLLYEQWYEHVSSSAQEATITAQRELLAALTTFSRHTLVLPPEAEHFLLRHVLPAWDGSLDEVGQYLCYDLIPALSPRKNFSSLRSQVLQHLETLFVHGDCPLQYAIVAGALANLVARWGTWSEPSLFGGASVDETARLRVLRELTQWTDDLLLRGFAVSGSSELLRLAAVDFFLSVFAVTEENQFFLAAPSPAIVFRLLLSTSALSVDRACHLLVKYKGTLRQRRQNQSDETGQATTGLDRVKLFNCYLWDYCSVLWRCSPPPSPDKGNDESARNLSILYTDLRPETQSRLYQRRDRVSSALSITHGAIFAAYAAEFLRRCNSSDSNPLRGKRKVEYLDYLRNECGLEGVHEFLYASVASLAQLGSHKERSKCSDL